MVFKDLQSVGGVSMNELRYSDGSEPTIIAELPSSPWVNVSRNRLRQCFRHKTTVAFIAAATVSWGSGQLLASSVLDEKGVWFIMTLAAGIVLWVSESVDDYVVALILLLSWIILDVVSPSVALSGYSTESWFFLIAALGIAATVTRSGVFSRLAFRVLQAVPLAYRKTHGFLLFSLGVLLTPLIPTGKARITLLASMLNAIIQAFGFKSRSNDSAALMLAAYLGIGQMSFLFLTGGTENLGAWSLLPESTKAEFGWFTWAVAAFPLGIVTSLLSLVAVYLVFPSKPKQPARSFSAASMEEALGARGSWDNREWLAIGILTVAFVGWMTTSIHGVREVWIATGAFILALITGALDKESLRKNLDWGFVLFFGVICSMGAIADKLRIDRWLATLTEPFLFLFIESPTFFLLATVPIVSIVRLFLRKTAAYIFLTLSLVSWAPIVGIHPGIILLTIVFAGEGWFFHYQDGSYQMIYSMTEGQAFSHRQAQVLMLAKFIAVFVALALCVPYWRYLGLVH